MQQDEIARLRYRRQYLVSPVAVVCPFLHNSYDLGGGNTLYAHPDLNVTEYAENGIRIFLLGDMFDYI
ncbi:MAG: hypothetical protein KAT15_09980, partial [Bacteroidales bacterium]|nr:hypothetical protein [Bacteroidales bacterium]